MKFIFSFPRILTLKIGRESKWQGFDYLPQHPLYDIKSVLHLFIENMFYPCNSFALFFYFNVNLTIHLLILLWCISLIAFLLEVSLSFAGCLSLFIRARKWCGFALMLICFSPTWFVFQNLCLPFIFLYQLLSPLHVFFFICAISFIFDVGMLRSFVWILRSGLSFIHC